MLLSREDWWSAEDREFHKTGPEWKKELLAFESDKMCISKYRPSRHLSVAYLTAVDETVSYCRTLYSIPSLTLSQWSDWSIGVM